MTKDIMNPYEGLLAAVRAGMAEQAPEFVLAVKESAVANADGDFLGTDSFQGMSDCNYETYYCLQ